MIIIDNIMNYETNLKYDGKQGVKANYPQPTMFNIH